MRIKEFLHHIKEDFKENGLKSVYKVIGYFFLVAMSFLSVCLIIILSIAFFEWIFKIVEVALLMIFESVTQSWLLGISFAISVIVLGIFTSIVMEFMEYYDNITKWWIKNDE